MTRYVELRLGGSPVLLGLRSAFPREIKPVDPFKRDTLLTRMRAAPGAMLAIRQGIDALGLPVTARLLPDDELARQIDDAVRRDGLVFVSLGTSANQLRPQPYRPAAERSAKVSEWSTGEKIEEALRRAIRLVPGEVGNSIAAMLSPEAIATTIGMLVALAVANVMGVGVVLDAALAAYAFYAAGMAGMRALAEFAGATGGLMDAHDEKDIDRAAQVYAQAFVVLGTAFLQRFLKAARRKADAGVSSKKSGGKVAVSTKPGSRETGRAPVQRSKAESHSGNPKHGVSKIDGRGAPDQKFTADRAGKAVNMRHLSGSDQAAARRMQANGYSMNKQRGVLNSAQPGSFKENPLKKGEKLYSFVTAGKGKNPDSPFWMTESQLNELKANPKIYDGRQWNKPALKDHLGLPCTNQVGAIAEGTVSRDQIALRSIVGRATETVKFPHAEPMKKVLNGGAGQLHPQQGTVGSIKVVGIR
ncbi:MAG: hypothetical protein QOH81_1552 [Sphingomonadales bacterium]|jgi:hypothetical protein|nr:hypothetical protein [Sphingomonadales bacterium]